MDQQLTLVEQLIAIAIDSMACNATITLLTNQNTTAAKARGVLRDLTALRYLDNLPTALDTSERAMELDIILRLKSGQTNYKAMGGDLLDFVQQVSPTTARGRGASRDDIRAAARQVEDWDTVLARCNEFQDRLVAAARLPAGTAKQEALAKIDAELKQADVRKDGPAAGRLRSFAGVPPAERSAVFASAMIGLLSPAVVNTFSVQDRANATLEMTRLAAALAAFRAERGRYPDRLDELVPAHLAAMPVDAFNAKPFAYQRDGDGYLLYSLGANGVDDAGVGLFAIARDFQEGMDDAQRKAHQAKTRAGADDVSLRLPLPAFEFPK
jgi:hypothetical protein